MTVRCPKCKWTGSGKAYMAHYARKHYKAKAKGKNKITVGKIPIWARRK